MTAQLQEAPVDESHETSLEADGSSAAEECAERDRRSAALEELIGACPGLGAATDLQALRDEWER